MSFFRPGIGMLYESTLNGLWWKHLSDVAVDHQAQQAHIGVVSWRYFFKYITDTFFPAFKTQKIPLGMEHGILGNKLALATAYFNIHWIVVTEYCPIVQQIIAVLQKEEISVSQHCYRLRQPELCVFFPCLLQIFPYAE